MWPYSDEAQASFEDYLTNHGVRPLSTAHVWVRRRVSHLDQLVADNLTARVRKGRRTRLLRKLKTESMLFGWANTHLKGVYCQALRGSDGQDLHGR